MALIDCHECGTQISDKAAACIKCGAPVIAAITVTAQPTTGICPSCKAVNSLDTEKCAECGALFAGQGGWKLLPHHTPNPLPVFESVHSFASSSSADARPHLVKSAKSRGVYVILGLFFGLLGIHNFYAGRFGIGAMQLLITCILGWFVVGLVITAIWSLADLFMVTTDGAGDPLA